MPSSRLTLRQLSAIAAVYRTGKVSSAANELHITQSAASLLLRQAEETLGLKLFDRTTRALTPTEAAEHAIGLVDRILGDVDKLGTTVEDIRTLGQGQVRLTTTPATGQALLPHTVQRFRASYPAITLVLDDCAPNQFLANIRQERADLGVGTPPRDGGEFDSLVLHDDPLCLIAPSHHPLTKGGPVPWTALKDQPLILSRRDYGVRGQVEETLMQLGLRATIAAEIGFLGSAFWMAEAGIGLCVLPQRMTRGFLVPPLLSIPLIDPVVTRPIAVVTLKGRSLSPSGQCFVEMLREDLAPCSA